jgi:hypothetical protein
LYVHTQILIHTFTIGTEKHLVFIVGMGNHSEGGIRKIKPAMEEMITKKYGYVYISVYTYIYVYVYIYECVSWYICAHIFGQTYLYIVKIKPAMEEMITMKYG